MNIMASISGYAGDPATLAAWLDPATGVLAILKRVEYRELADAGFAFVTNTRCESYDCLFQEEHWQEAIRAYMEGVGNEMLVMDDAVSRYDPRVESDGLDEKGQKYRLPTALENGQVAMLALAHFQARQRAIQSADDGMDEFFDLVMI